MYCSVMATSSDSASRTMLMSAYELEREERIRRNKAMLSKLGLLRPASVVRTPAGSGARPKPSPAKRKRKSKRAPAQPQRKSRRLQKLGAELSVNKAYAALEGKTASVGNDESEVHPYWYDSEEAEKARNAAYAKLAEAHLRNGIKLPKNATYAHTYMRVRTMSEKALLRRVGVIERAQGRWAVVKMRMFAEVLILEGYNELAEEARKALSRLLELERFRTYREAYANEEKVKELLKGVCEGSSESKSSSSAAKKA